MSQTLRYFTLVFAMVSIFLFSGIARAVMVPIPIGDDVVVVVPVPEDDKYRIATTKSTWNNFATQLNTGKYDQALLSISSETRDQYRPLLTNPIFAPLWAKSIKRFYIVDVNDVAVKAAIVINTDGIDTMFFVTFGKDTDGSWKIYSM